MRNVIPQIGWVQDLETSLAGSLGLGVEGSNATVPGDDAYHDNTANILYLPPIDPYGPITRYIDIFSRGTDGCSWSLVTGEYLAASPSSGHIDGSGNLDTRVYLSVPDWKKVPEGSTVVTMNFSSTCNYGNYGPPQVQVVINKTEVPTYFTSGFVESDGHVSIEAEHSTRNSSISGISYMIMGSYGRTLSRVTLFPVNVSSQSPPSSPVLEYDFYTFSNLSTIPANITLYLSPSLNYLGPARPLKYGIAVDNDPPTIVQPVAKITSGNFPRKKF